jgi:hypothetical protein
VAEPSPTLPLLEQIRIAAPCPVAWDSMHGDARSRLCGECNRRVYNLAAMTRAEAETLIRETEGNICGQLWRRADGAVITADCPVGVANFRRRVRRALVGAVLLGAAFLSFTLQAFGRTRAAQAVQDSGALTKLRKSVEPLPPAFGIGGFFSIPSAPEKHDGHRQ